MRSCCTLVLLLLCIAAGVGCKANKPPPPPEPKPLLKKPAIDLSHGGGGFPVEANAIPANSNELIRAIYQAYALRLQQPAKIRINAQTVPGQTGPLAPLKLLDIDLTGSTVRGDYIPKDGLKKDTQPLGTMRVAELSYVADPLKYQNYTAGMRMTATRAELALSPTNDGKLNLALVDCRKGNAHLQVDLDSLRASLQEGVKIKRTLAFMIDKIDLDFASANPRNLSVRAVVHSRVLLVPATFSIVGRADVDDDFNVHFSNLDAHGLDPTGKVVAELVQSRLDKANGRAAPLMKLPGDKIRVTAFKIHLDHKLAVDVGFKGTK